MAAVCHKANGPTVSSCFPARVFADARILHLEDHCVLARSFRIRRDDGGVRGAAELALLGAYLACEAIAIIFVDAAVAAFTGAFVMARNFGAIIPGFLRNDESVFALDKLFAFCRGLMVGDEEASEEESDGVTMMDEHDAEIN